MLVARLGMADIAGPHGLAVFLAAAAVMHGDGALQQHEHFSAVIDVPDVGTVGPMQANGYALDLGDRQGAPGRGGGEIAWCHKLHGPGSSSKAKRPVSSFRRESTGIVARVGARPVLASQGTMARKLDHTDQQI